jgi:ribosome maturation factor RimP
VKKWALGPFFVCACGMDILERLVRTVAGLGYELVDFERSGRGLVRVFIDKPGGVGVNDCAAVSNQLTRLFAAEQFDYKRLEVSSPGLDRPLKKASDFKRFRGEKARVRVRVPVDGRRNLVGVLRGVTGEMVELELNGEVVSIDLRNVDRARLIPKI